MAQAGTPYIDGVSDQNLQSWDSYPSAFFHGSWVASGASHITISRYVVQWNVMSGGYPAYRSKYEAWYGATAALGLTPEVALTSYDHVLPKTSAEYRVQVEQLLNLKPIAILEAWNEPNYSPFISEAAASHYANSAYALCKSRGCTLIAGDFLDSANMVSYETNYEKRLNPANPPNWGIHPYFAVKSQSESPVASFRANLPNSGDAIWFTEIGAYKCFRDEQLGALPQAVDASWLVNRLMPDSGPAHVLYYEFLGGNPPPCSASNPDTALYLPSGDANAPDAPRPAANYVYNGRGTPSAYTGPPASIETPQATMTGSVYPGGFFDTHYHFEYGTTTAYGSYSSEADAGSGSGGISASIRVGGLAPGTRYHYRLVGWNKEGSSDEGPSVGSDQTLETQPAPTVATGPAPSVQEEQPIFNGAVSPDGLDCVIWPGSRWCGMGGYFSLFGHWIAAGVQ